MRVITFSRFFPAYHPRKGEETHFVEKIWKGLWDNEPSSYIPFDGYWQRYDEAFPTGETFKAENNIHSHYPKSHTIRAGNRWKVGDKFSPRVWGDDINPKSGKKGAYQSKQIEIAPPIEIKKIWTFEIGTTGTYALNEDYSISLTAKQVIEIAKNDGLHVNDFFAWFEKSKKPFYGQIICWNENINY